MIIRCVRDEKYMNKITEQEFHKSRIAFMLIENKIIYLENSSMSHFEWYISLGYKKEQFKNIIRGYYKDGKIVFYKDDFTYDNDVIEIAKKINEEIKKYVNDRNAEVYVGVKKGKIGEIWEPELKIK